MIVTRSALKIVDDSIREVYGDKAVKRSISRLPPGLSFAIPQNCPGRLPKSMFELDGISLDNEIPEPIPPRAPSGRKRFR